VDVPDDFGGFILHNEVPELIRIASPIYVKLGVRNAPNIYPSGIHIEPTAINLARERVHRAELVSNLIQRYCPDAVMSATGATDLGIPALETVR
jgi:hypothetical protein